MPLVISVTPAGDGWEVSSAVFDNRLVFKSGGRAEAAARRLAERYAGAGIEAEVRVFVRGGALAGAFLHPARVALPEAAA